MNKEIQAFLKKACKKSVFKKNYTYIEFEDKANKAIIKMELKGKDTLVRALREVVKVL